MRSQIFLTYEYGSGMPNYFLKYKISKKSSKKETDKKDEKEEAGNMETENVQTLAEIFNQEIIHKGKMGQFSSESIVTFPEIPLVVPR